MIFWPSSLMSFVYSVVALAVVTISTAILFVFNGLATLGRSKVAKCRPRSSPIHLLVVLGSGGHTAEMFSMLRRMELNPSKYSYRSYVVSSGDSFSAAKAVEFEKILQGDTDASFRLQNAPLQSSLSLMSGSVPFMDSPPSIEGPSMNNAPSSMPPPLMGSPPPLMGAPAPMQDIPKESYSIVTVPRARRVHQPFWTAPLSTLECLWACIRVLCGRYPDQKPLPLSFSVYPDLILTNGPATGFCMILAAKVIRFCRLLANKKKNGEKPTVEDVRLRTIFVESWARVTTLSLSGKLLLPFVDRFLVQWPALQGKGAFWGVKKTEYAGALVD